MKFSCPECSAKYQIADEKVADRTLQMKCRRCDCLIPVRKPPSAESLAAAPSAQAFSIAPSTSDVIPPHSPPIELWHAAIWGLPVGPMTREQLEARVLDGSVAKNSFVWKEGMLKWERIVAVEGLSEMVPLLADVAGPPTMPPAIKSEALGTELKRSKPSSALVLYQPPQRRSPAALVFALLAAGFFGGTIGFVLFGGQKTRIVKEIIEVAAAPEEGAEAKESDADGALGENAAQVDDDVVEVAPSQKKKAARKRTKAETPGAVPESGIGNELAGLSGLSSLAGPGSAGLSPTTSGATSPLSDSQIQSTVARGQSGVKRGCWDRALMSRDKNAPSTARVTVKIVVSSQGRVTNSSAGRDPSGYPGLASCVAGRVRGWSFPPSNGVTTVNVPFVFASQ